MVEFVNYEPADIEIHMRGRGMVRRDKSLMAVRQQDGKILAFGAQAEEIAYENMDGVCVFSPLRRGQIADFSAAVKLFKYMVQQTWGKGPFHRPRIVVSMPPDMTEVERKALEDAFVYGVGAKAFSVSETPPEHFEGEYDLFIVITKDEPEKYIAEEFSRILQYAAQEKISAARVQDILKAQREK